MGRLKKKKYLEYQDLLKERYRPATDYKLIVPRSVIKVNQTRMGFLNKMIR